MKWLKLNNPASHRSGVVAGRKLELRGHRFLGEGIKLALRALSKA